VTHSRAIIIGSTLCCRSYIEKFAQFFVEEHDAKSFCPRKFDRFSSTTSILQHFEECLGVTLDTNKRMGDTISNKLESQGIRLPSDGSFLGIFKELSEKVHHYDVLQTNTGKAVVPVSLPIVSKRFMTRYIKYKGYDIVICEEDGNLREPLEEEITTPPKKMRPSSISK
jgi:hypothetical protein